MQMRPQFTRRHALTLLGGAFGALTGCRHARPNTIVVGSKNFTEQIILAELLAQQVAAHTSLRVDRRLNLGGTLICHRAMLAGQLDMYAEYTGTALAAVLNEPSSNDTEAVYRAVHDAYRDRFGFDVGPPLGFNNTFAIVVRSEDAKKNKLRTISDLVPHAPQWRAGFGYEFMERSDGYPGLARAYGLRFAAAPSIMDLGLLYRALKEHQVDVVAGNSTDGLIIALGMVILEDDRHFFPPYQAVTVVRGGTLNDHPDLRGPLDVLGGKISDSEMRQMNYAVDAEQRDPAAVARDFRRQKGL
ncbi:MAG TPA: glycine betaine ABC transporter substrate-binding protein [Candidatus Acidoferrales bacterium]|jgi:glycine betaine/choline ABC-type transport system substrate-binding protein|nr:glycine betaine ABC transporter substrate-binding protein [Candidatus Acidoferrales bacterium]